ncbi:MAG: glycosyltransferase family 2 protein [Ginsengibacter sp.]
MNQFSIVIITKNEEDVLERTLKSVQGITDDLVIVDSGSTDTTLAIASQFTSHIIKTEWLGYGATKNLGINASKYNWILSLDADEAIDETLKKNLLALRLEQETIVYKADFKNFIGEHCLRHGGYLKSTSVILFNKKHVKWGHEEVHEKLVIPGNFSHRKLEGNVLHYTMKDLADFNHKMSGYAMLGAQKYFNQGRKVSKMKILFVRRFSLLRNFIFRGGFLDGYAGLVAASLYAHYTFLKYARLRELLDARKKNHP